MYLLYTIAYGLALLVSSPYWLLGMLRAGKYRAGLRERFGAVPLRLKLPAPGEQSIWIHAVSVGEVLGVAGVIAGLEQGGRGARVFLSTTTLAGQKLARQRFGDDRVFYLPLDLPFAVNAFLRALRPRLLILAETEFWPNLLHLSKTHGARVAVCNARISDRSLPGYRRFRSLLRRVLDNVDLFLAQTGDDRDRLVSIGAKPERVRVSGNLKFDIRVPEECALSRSLRGMIGTRRVLIFGSTVEGEESVLLPCMETVLRDFPDALILLAPRHPERFDSVAELLRRSVLSFCRRSIWNGASLPSVMLLDSIGELASVYALAEIAFVGGSLVPRGGHNILEPAQFGKAIVVGPHTENFREIIRLFEAHEALRITDAEHLSSVLLHLLNSPHERSHHGSRAWAVVESGRGSTQRTLDALSALMNSEIDAREMASAHQQ